MRKHLIMLFIIIIVCLTSNYAVAQSTVVIKAEDMEMISLSRLSDIYSILPQLDLYTIDRYRHTPLAGNQFRSAYKGITILMNGTRTNFGLMNKTNLSQFPVNPAVIESIIISYKPISYHGEFSSGILVDIITKKPAEGISFSAAYATGNEAGDPGPYLYTEHYSENVDQFGPNTYFSSNYGSESFSLTLNFVDQVSPTTDPAVLQRVNNFFFQNYQVRYSGFSAHSAVSSDLGDHNIFTSLTKTGQAVIGFEYGADLYFVDDLSTEFPLENVNFIFSSGNRIALSQGSEIILDANLNFNAIRQSEFNPISIGEWDDLRLFSKAGLKSKLGIIDYFIGSSFAYQNIKNNTTNLKHNGNLKSIFASLDMAGNENPSISIDANFRFGEYSPGMFIRLASDYKFSEHHKIGLSVSFDSLFDVNSFPGYIFDNELITQGISLKQNPQFSGGASNNSIGLNYTYLLNEKSNFSTGIDLTNYSNFSFHLNDFVYRLEERNIASSETEYFDNIKGWTGEFYFAYSNNISKKVFHKVYYRYNSVFSSDDIFKKAMKRIPDHKVFYSIYYSLYKDITASLILNFQSSAEWIDYRNIESGSNNRYFGKLPEIVLVNCAVTKKFWSDKVRISATIHNLLNKRIQYHPVGGSFDLTFFIKAEADLQSIIRF